MGCWDISENISGINILYVEAKYGSSAGRKETASFVGALGAKSARSVITYVLSNSTTIDQPVADDFHNFHSSLRHEGVDQIVGLAGFHFLPDNIPLNPTIFPVRNLTVGSSYMIFLEEYKQSWKTLSSEFPEVDYWQMGNELNLNSNLHKEGYVYGSLDNTFTSEEKAQIITDMTYFAKQGISEGNPLAKTILFSLGSTSSTGQNFEEMRDFLELIYSEINTRADSNTSNYFDALSWHPYYATWTEWFRPNQTWVDKNNMIYDIARDGGDGNKKVFLTEFGYNDHGISSEDVIHGGWIKEAYQLLKNASNKMDYVESMHIYRLYSHNASDDNYGVYKDPSIFGYAPKQKAYDLQDEFGGIRSLTSIPECIVNDDCGSDITCFSNTCQACTPSPTNTSWSPWTNSGTCQTNDLQLQSRNLIQYDLNNCSEISNQTFTEYKNITCNYCSYNETYTPWTSWINTSECVNNNMSQSKNQTKYDSNYSTCHLMTNLESDHLLNVTSGETRVIVCGVECVENITNSSWSSWANSGNCKNSLIRQTRWKKQSDINRCGETDDEYFFEYQNVSCSTDTGGSNGGSSKAKTYTATSNNLKTGFSKTLERKEKIKFAVGNADHHLTVDIVGNEYVRITISSTPQTKDMKENETWEVDVDYDGIKDVGVFVESISSKKVDVEISEILQNNLNDIVQNKTIQNNSKQDKIITQNLTALKNEINAENDNAKENKLFWVIIGVVSIIFIGIGLLLIIAFRYKIEGELNGDTSEIDLQPLKNFISESRARGVSDERIKELLLNEGWNEEMINEEI